MKVFFSLTITALIFLSACSSKPQTKTITTETTYQTIDPNSQTEGYPTQTIVKKVETKEVEEKKRTGVIGSGLVFIGNVIAFPFRLIGSALGLLF